MGGQALGRLLNHLLKRVSDRLLAADDFGEIRKLQGEAQAYQRILGYQQKSTIVR